MALQIEQVAAVLPSYEIGGELGRGSTGIVLAARHRDLRRDVAIKLLPPDLAQDEDVRRRFLAEARLLASFSHPHIVPIYDFVEQQGICLLVMERLAGGTLDGYARAGLNLPGSCAAVLALASALQYAHDRGVLHRDVKPGNVLVAEDGIVKVTDFGIAKVLGGSNSVVTRAGFVLGTPAYMAPEQAEGRQPGPATDVYGAGTVLYQLLAGRLPFEAEGSALQLLFTKAQSDPAPLQSVAPDVPAGLADVVMRSLARDSGARYVSAEAFGVAVGGAATQSFGPDWLSRTPFRLAAAGGILSAAHGGSLRAVSETIVDAPAATDTAASGAIAVAAPPGGAPPGAEPAPSAAPPGGGNRRLLVALAVVLLVAVVAGGVALLAGGDDSKPASSAPLPPTPNTAPASKWTPVTPSGEPRQQAPAAVQGGTVWVIGGLRDGPTGFPVALQTVQGYETALGEWKTEPTELPVELHHAMAVTYHDDLVAMGGWIPDGADLSATTSGRVFELRGDRWTSLPSLASPRAAAGAAVADGKIVVVGGQWSKGQAHRLVRTTEIYDGDSWKRGADIPTPREHLAVVSDGSRYVYAVGGRHLDAGKNTAALERYDPAADTWKKLAPMPKPMGGLGAAYLQGRIVAVGGETSNDVFGTTWIYNVRRNRWTEGPPLENARHGMAVAAFGHTVYALDGAEAAGHTNSTDLGESLTFNPRGGG